MKLCPIYFYRGLLVCSRLIDNFHKCLELRDILVLLSDKNIESLFPHERKFYKGVHTSSRQSNSNTEHTQRVDTGERAVIRFEGGESSKPRSSWKSNRELSRANAPLSVIFFHRFSFVLRFAEHANDTEFATQQAAASSKLTASTRPKPPGEVRNERTLGRASSSE